LFEFDRIYQYVKITYLFQPDLFLFLTVVTFLEAFL